MSVLAREAGFTLIEAVAVLAIVAMLAALALPARPRGTTRPQLQALALRVAAVLKADRNAALRAHAKVETHVGTAPHAVVSGAGAGIVTIPEDVAFDALLAENCGSGAAIVFLPSGQSCGGTIALARRGAAYRVRIDWFTGGIEIVDTER